MEFFRETKDSGINKGEEGGGKDRKSRKGGKEGEGKLNIYLTGH